MQKPPYSIFALAFPVLILLLFGTMYGNEPNEFMGGFGSVDALVLVISA